MDNILKNIRIELLSLADPERATHSQRFFKTGPGEYAEGDKFLGISVPVLRKLSKEYKAISIAAASELLESKFHEERLLALFILIELYRQADTKGRNSIYSLYLSKSCFVNNWDLVDSSAEHIVGATCGIKTENCYIKWQHQKVYGNGE